MSTDGPDSTPTDPATSSEGTAPEEVRHLIQQWHSLDELLAGLKKDDWTAQTALPGWTVRDVVAHVAGTEHMLSGEPVPDVELPESAREYVHNPIGELNEKFVQEKRSLAGPDARTCFPLRRCRTWSCPNPPASTSTTPSASSTRSLCRRRDRWRSRTCWRTSARPWPSARSSSPR